MKLLLSALFLLIPLFLIGQCPDTVITYLKQELLDNFKEDFPNCTVLQHEIEIRGEEITNLDALSDITGSKSNVYIAGVENLTSIEGLMNLEYVDGDLTISSNDNLTSLNGLQNLSTVGNINIKNDENLTSIEGLMNLEYVDGDLAIQRNDNLTSLNGLQNLSTVGNIIITDNDNLTSIEGLMNLKYVDGDLRISSNDNLTSLNGLQSLSIVGDMLVIRENNRLSKIDFFHNLKSVDFLTLGNLRTNNLTEFKGLDVIKRGLSCEELSGFRNFEGFEKINNLNIERIDLYGNPELESTLGIDNISISEEFIAIQNHELVNLDNINFEDSISVIRLHTNYKLENCCSLDLFKNEDCCEIVNDDCLCLNFPEANIRISDNGFDCLNLGIVYSVCFGDGNYCVMGNKYEYLNANDVNACINNAGNSFYHYRNLSQLRYEVPKGSEKQSVFAAALWMGGIDEDDKLKISTPTYQQFGSYFRPGPILEDASESACKDFNKLWNTRKEEVDEFISIYIDKKGNVDINDIPNSVLNYPGKNNPLFNEFELPENEELAPFIDSNMDGNYNPLDGDFPLVKGDQSIWWIYNDAKIFNDSDKEPLNINMEVSVTAYSKKSTDYINRTTFYDYKLEYLGDKPLKDFYIGLWVDTDLGEYDNDYIGCNVDQNMGYTYNGETTDVGAGSYGDSIPALGVKLIKSIKDKENNEVPLSSFRHYRKDWGAIGWPETVEQFYYFLCGKWRDGTLLTYGGNGHGGDELYPYMYPDPPTDPNGWSELTDEIYPGDRKFLMTYGPIDLMPGDVQTITKVILWEPNVGGGEEADLSNLFKIGEQVELDYDSLFEQECKGLVAYYQDLNGDGLGEPETKVVSCEPLDGFITNVDTDAIVGEIQNVLAIFPNPASNSILFSLNVSEVEMAEIEIFDLAGKSVFRKSQNLSIEENKVLINIEEFAPAIYFVKVIDEHKNQIVGKFVKK